MTTSLTPDQLAFLQSVDSPTVANAIEQFKVRDRSEGFTGGSIRCLFPDLGVMVGNALTITMDSKHGPVAGRDGYWRMWEALENSPKPAVIAVQDVSGAPSRCAYFGEVMATIARRLGAVGVVTDGGVRDLTEVHALGLHYFARYPVVSHGNFEIVEVGNPIRLDGQEVRTGDLLHGDLNGIVIVPRELLSELPQAVEQVRAREKRIMEFVAQPSTLAAREWLERLRQVAGY